MTTDAPEVTATGVPGWGRGASSRFLGLAVGRAAAQVLGMVWFLLAARSLGASDFGVVATGLAFFAIFAGLGDLGTTRTVVRYVAADERTMWSAYRKALGLRLAGGLAVGAVVAAAVALLPVPVSPWAVALAGLMATASGATELAYAALRSVGHVRVELALLIGERLAFLAIGAVALAQDRGPLVILGIYLATNVVSALLSGVAVRRSQPGPSQPVGSMVDAEARFTAAGFALVTVAPRVPSVLVAVFASASAVGVFAVAQRPIEALTLFALSTCAPVLPIIRGRIARGQRDSAEHAAAAVTAALLLALAPLVAWFLVSPATALQLLFGGDRYESADIVLRVLGFTAATWALRGVGEFILLGEERARTLFTLTSTGTAVTIVAGIPLVVLHEEVGAAITVALSEAVMTVLLLRAVPALRDRAAARAYGPALAVVVATALGLVVADGSTLPSAAVVALACLPAGWLALGRVRTLERDG